MTQPLSTVDNNIDLSSLKHIELGSASSRASCRRFWQRLSELFWAYTEKSGEADTSSYKGLL